MVNERNDPAAGALPEDALPAPKQGRAASMEVRGLAVAAVLRGGSADLRGPGEKRPAVVEAVPGGRPSAARQAGRREAGGGAPPGRRLPHPGGAAVALQLRAAGRAGIRGRPFQRGDAAALPEAPRPRRQEQPRPRPPPPIPANRLSAGGPGAADRNLWRSQLPPPRPERSSLLRTRSGATVERLPS